jgi:hypothetical protein
MATLGDLVVRIGANTKDLNKKLGEVQRNTRRSFGNIEKLGKSMAVSVTLPVAAMAATSVQAFREQQKAIAQVNAGLKSTGAQVGFTSKQLQNMSSELQKNTLFGDEQILKDATAQLLTFTNISGEQFDRTQKAALDLATRLDGDLKGASIQLGKALNDPVANLSALSRSGIQFSEEQKAVIKSLTETGRLAEAQTLILDELDKQYGGSAEAAAEADGGITQLTNAFGDLQEEIGRVVLKAIKPLIKFAQDLIEGFHDLNGVTKSFIVGFGAVAAAVGPILLILPKLANIAQIVGPAIGKAFTLMTGPIGLAVLAIAAITTAIFYFWDDVKGPLTNVINTFIELYNQNEFLRVAIAILKTTFVSAFKIMKGALMAVVDTFKVLFKAIKAALTDGFGAGFDVLVDGLSEIKDDVLSTAAEVGEDFQNAVQEAITKEPIELVTEEDLDNTKDKFVALFDFFSDYESPTIEPVVVPVVDTAPVLGAIDEISEDLDDDFVDDLDFDSETFLAKLRALRDMSVAIMEDIESAIQNAAGALLNDLGNAIGTIISQGADSVNLMGVALQNLANLLQDIGRALITQAVAMIAFKKLLFKNPVAAAAAGVAFVAAGAILSQKAKQLEMPALAQGGLAYGPTTALIGDNRNARIDPEVVAPLSKLKDMMGGNQVEVFGRISGNDIYLSNSRTGTSRNRYA